MNHSTHSSPAPFGRVLIIAGSDSGGGAGIQGDIKTVSALGGYAMTAITALTAQNTQGVFGIHPVPEDFIAQQITLCLSDIGANAIKTGMLHSAGVIEAVVQSIDHFSFLKDANGRATSYSPLAGESKSSLKDFGGGSLAQKESPHQSSQENFGSPSGGEQAAAPLSQNPSLPATGDWRLATPLVVDPVMVAKGGAPLLEAAALDALKTLLIPRAALITPNLPEAELLLARTIRSDDDATDMQRAAEELLELGAQAVLLKGGHGTGEMLTDILVTRHQAPGTKHLLTLTTARIATRNTHGTGCAFASAIATGLAQKLSLADAVTRAHAYVQAAIARAPGFGAGNGPLGH